MSQGKSKSEEAPEKIWFMTCPAELSVGTYKDQQSAENAANRHCDFYEHPVLRVLAKISATADVSAGEWLQASDLPQSTFFRHRKQLELGEFVAKRNGKYSVTDKGREAATP